MSSDARNFGCPPCPDSPQAPQHARMPGSATCPRSDVYRMTENGTAQNIFGWGFRCRTCKMIFFRDSPDARRHALREANLNRLAQQAQQERR